MNAWLVVVPAVVLEWRESLSDLEDSLPLLLKDLWVDVNAPEEEPPGHFVAVDSLDLAPG